MEIRQRGNGVKYFVTDEPPRPYCWKCQLRGRNCGSSRCTGMIGFDRKREINGTTNKAD